MLGEIEFSTMLSDSDARDRLQDLVKTFENREKIKVHLTSLDLNTGSNDVFQSALHRSGPSVSEISPAWLASLVAMNSLKPVPASIRQSIGDEGAFLSGAWQSCFFAGSDEMWAVPWTSGTQLLFFRRDWLAQAGIDEAAAFVTLESLEATLSSLKGNGIERPWVINTHRSSSTLQHMASWVWGYGGDFVSQDGRKLLLTAPSTLKGMAAYYKLHQYMGEAPEQIDDERAASLFWGGKAAVMLDGHWVYSGRTGSADPEFIKNIGIAKMPGVPFVGGSHLAVWKHSRYPEAAWKLVRYLTGQGVTYLFEGPDQMLPARWDTLRSIGVEKDLFMRRCAESIDAGRVFTSKKWGMLLENRLSAPLAAIWRAVLEHPDADIQQILIQNLKPLEQRLQQTLQN